MGTRTHGPSRAQWRRVGPVAGQPLDLLHAHITEPYAPHRHEQFAIGVCLAGVETIHYRGAAHHVWPGTVALLPPDETHTGAPVEPEGFVYRVMYPGAALLADSGGRVPRFTRPIVEDPALAAELARVHAELGRETEPLAAESRLAWLFGELVRRHAQGRWPEFETEARGVGGVVRRVMDRLAEQVACPPGLAEIAEATGLSRYQLVRAFRAEIGMPPYAWLAQHRVFRARALLEHGAGLAEAAATVGFADQAHLTRWFRRVVGVTPGAFRASVHERPLSGDDGQGRDNGRGRNCVQDGAGGYL